MHCRHDRSIRRLTQIARTASTARVLNLRAAQIGADRDPGSSIHQAPFFKHPALNYSIILKHRLRPNERRLFTGTKTNATKVLLPIDNRDLRAGARFVMVGEASFDDFATEFLGDALAPGSPDRQMLELIDELPALDPFLLSGHLSRYGFRPASEYFAISEPDIARMLQSTERELGPLAAMAGDSCGSAARLVAKILSSRVDLNFAALRTTFGLGDEDFSRGMFAWRGFLYYKWVANEIFFDLVSVAKSIRGVQIRGRATPDQVTYVAGARDRICRGIKTHIDSIQQIFRTYDSAYCAMTRGDGVREFREFLLASPDLFLKLGEQIGACSHIVSFWKYRFSSARMVSAPPEDIEDIFIDFEDSLTTSLAPAAERQLAIAI